MKNKNSLVLLFAALATLSVAAMILALPGHTQSNSAAPPQSAETSSAATTLSLAPEAAARPRVVLTARVTPANAAAYASAAARNAALLAPGQAREWSIYLPLISHLIGAEQSPGTPEFAAALAEWQRSAGMPAGTGIFCDDTMRRMSATWQGRRARDFAYPTPEQLITAPPSDFYAPTRPAELRQVERRTYEAYKRMLAAAIADPTSGLAVTPDGQLAANEQYLRIISSFRSREYQAQLRRQNPGASRAALAVTSPHFTGRALDIYVGGEPVSTAPRNRAIQSQTRIYQWLVKNAEHFGFVPYFYEPWHWEYRPDLDRSIPSAEQTARQ